MSEKIKDNKTDFIRLVMSSIAHDSSNKEKAIEYLTSQGLNVESIMAEGKKRINKMNLKIEADKTRNEMKAAEVVKQKATEWADKILNDISFSFPEFIKKEKLSLAFNSLQSLSKEDVKNILVQHFTLKFLEDQKK
jgi:hypothetical protein